MISEAKVLTSAQMARKVGVVVGTRPGIVMFAPIIHELRRRSVPHLVIHTGQHYSPNMDAQFFRRSVTARQPSRSHPSCKGFWRNSGRSLRDSWPRLPDTTRLHYRPEV